MGGRPRAASFEALPPLARGARPSAFAFLFPSRGPLRTLGAWGLTPSPWVRNASQSALGPNLFDVQRQLFLTDLKAPAKVGQIRKFNNVFSEFFVAIAMDLAVGEDTDTAGTLARVRRTLAQAAVEFCAARSASSSVISAGEIALPAVHGQRVAQLYMYDICM